MSKEKGPESKSRKPWVYVALGAVALALLGAI